MPIEGPLKELDVHDVFQLLDLGRKSGTVRITSELRQNEGRVWFDGGAVIGAVIQSNPHPLGALLLRGGKIGEADLARARDRQVAGDARRLGDILVEMGAVTRRELERQVRAQVEEVVFELMSWSEGFFSFSEGGLAEAPIDACVRIPTEALLMEAARRIDEWSRIESRVPHLGVIPRLAEGDGGSLELTPFEWEVLAAADGARDLRALAVALGRSEFDVARTVFGLAGAGVIVLEDPAKTPPPPPPEHDLAGRVAAVAHFLAVGDADDARTAAEDLVAAYPGVAEGPLLLGRAHLAAGGHEAAMEASLHALRLDPLLAPAWRLLGLAQAGSARFAEAVESWDHWLRLTARGPEEDGHVAAVERLRDAALTLADSLRGRHD